jgi:hypothetical protein
MGARIRGEIVEITGAQSFVQSRLNRPENVEPRDIRKMAALMESQRPAILLSPFGIGSEKEPIHR